jgi:hypothetical protein
MFQSLGPFLGNCLVAMGLSKAVVSLATNAFQMGFVRYFPLQTMAKTLSIMERIARIRRFLHQNAQQIVVSIDVTFQSTQPLTKRKAVKYMAYCGYNDLWQCGDTDRTGPISCNTSDATTSDSSTFFMIEPTKLAKGSILPSTEPTTTQRQYIPTQWGKPESATSTTSVIVSPSTTFTKISLSITSVSTATPSPSSSPTSSQSSSSGRGLSAADWAGIGIAIALASLVVTSVGVWIAWKTLKKK